jgi:hypothetical protein
MRQSPYDRWSSDPTTSVDEDAQIKLLMDVYHPRNFVHAAAKKERSGETTN